jgi:hypothetical protein
MNLLQLVVLTRNSQHCDLKNQCKYGGKVLVEKIKETLDWPQFFAGLSDQRAFL